MTHRWLTTALLAGALVGAAPAWAADLYVTGVLGISTGAVDTGGATIVSANTGSDTDSSPVYGGALGYAFPLDEIIPRSYDNPLPSWLIRIELEGLLGRDYELITTGPDPYLTQISSWGFMNNLWVDLPVHAPVAWAFGRVPLIEPMTFQVGGGVGFGITEFATTNNVFSGSTEPLHLAWQAGAGLGYELTDRITFSLGYRYLDQGSVDYTLRNGPTPFGNFQATLVSHEVNAGLRINFFTVASPGSWSFRRGR